MSKKRTRKGLSEAVRIVLTVWGIVLVSCIMALVVATLANWTLPWWER